MATSEELSHSYQGSPLTRGVTQDATFSMALPCFMLQDQDQIAQPDLTYGWI